MIVNDIINDIIDVWHDGYRYLSNIKCIYVGILSLVISIDICQSKNMDIWCYIIIYGKVHNILGVILKYNNNVIIYELVNVYCCII